MSEPDLLAGVEPLRPPELGGGMERIEQTEITFEEARALYPGCHIVALHYDAPAEPHFPRGFWILLAVPEAKLIEALACSLPGPLGAFAATRPSSIRITPLMP